MIILKKGITATCASAILFGITPLITTCIYSFGINTMTTVFYRSLFALMLSGFVCLFRHTPLRISISQLKDCAIAAVLGSGLTTILLFQSYAYIDTGSATGLHFMYPLFVVVASCILFKESLGKRKLVALCLACIAMLMFLESGNHGLIGYVLAIASAITYAFYIEYCDKRRLTHMDSFQLSFYLALFTALQTLVIHLFQPQLQFSLPLPAYLLILLLALCSAILAVILLQIGIRLLGGSNASFYCLLEPITSLIIGILFLQESFRINKLIAAALIITALLLIYKQDQIQNNDTKSA